MPRVTNNLRDAQALAEFANLEPAQVEYFRNNYPDFAPQEWWDYQYNGSSQWQLTQKLLQDSWKNQFGGGIFSLIDLLNSVAVPSRLADAERAGERAVKKMVAERAGVPFKDADNEITLPPYQMRLGRIPLQRATVYLFENSWRARFCIVCNKRFVAAEPKNKFCGESCSHENSIRRKRRAWHLHKSEWRPTRKNRQRHATRDTKRRGIKD